MAETRASANKAFAAFLEPIRLRYRRTKGSSTSKTNLAMMFKLARAAQRGWRRLNGHEHLVLLLQARVFVDGVLQDAA
jgi:hypothetical protein